MCVQIYGRVGSIDLEFSNIKGSQNDNFFLLKYQRKRWEREEGKVRGTREVALKGFGNKLN